MSFSVHNKSNLITVSFSVHNKSNVIVVSIYDVTSDYNVSSDLLSISYKKVTRGISG